MVPSRSFWVFLFTTALVCECRRSKVNPDAGPFPRQVTGDWGNGRGPVFNKNPKGILLFYRSVWSDVTLKYRPNSQPEFVSVKMSPSALPHWHPMKGWKQVWLPVGDAEDLTFITKGGEDKSSGEYRISKPGIYTMDSVKQTGLHPYKIKDSLLPNPVQELPPQHVDPRLIYNSQSNSVLTPTPDLDQMASLK